MNDFDIEEVDMIESAALEWEEKTNNIITYQIYFNYDGNINKIKDKSHSIVVVKLSKFDEATKYYDELSRPNNILGEYERNGKVPRIFLVYDRMIGKTYYKGCLLHELGHAIGLKHIQEKGTLMYPQLDDGAKYITNADLKEFCDLYHCSVEKLNHDRH